MYKLNITLPVEKPANPIKRVNKYASPVGWWKVTTEGDCEGRTTTQLGEYYGHVAEIAFHLADKCYYKLTFDAIDNRETIIGLDKDWQATEKTVWIGLGIESGTWNMTPEFRAKYIKDWLDCGDQIEVRGTSRSATYHAGAYLTLK